MAAYSNKVDTDMLRRCYQECTTAHGFIAFTKEVRDNGHKHIKLHNLTTLFETSTTWKQIPNSSGHKIFKHRVTKIVVNIKAHKKSGGDQNVDPGAVMTILELVQKHLNILCNEIFQYKVNHWKKEPNYQESLVNYHNWKKESQKK